MTKFRHFGGIILVSALAWIALQFVVVVTTPPEQPRPSKPKTEFELAPPPPVTGELPMWAQMTDPEAMRRLRDEMRRGDI